MVTVSQIVGLARNMLQQWKDRRPIHASNHPHRSLQTWNRPPPEWLKCNSDARIFESIGKFSSGCVLRNDAGLFVAAKAMIFDGCVSPDIAEALSVREGLSWIKNHPLSRVYVETDAQTIIALAINSSSYNDVSPIGLIIDDC